MGAVFRSTKNDVAMSLGLEGNELGDDFVLAVSEEVGVVHEAKMLLVGFVFGKMQPEKFGNEFLTGLRGNKKQGVDEALVAASIEGKRSDQAGLRGRCKIGASDIFGANVGKQRFRDSVFAEDFAGQGKRSGALLGGGRFTGCDPEVVAVRIGGEGANLAANFHCAGVSQAGGSRASILLTHLALSNGSTAEEQRILCAGVDVFRREIFRSRRVGEAVGLYWRQNGIFDSRDRFDTQLAS